MPQALTMGRSTRAKPELRAGHSPLDLVPAAETLVHSVHSFEGRETTVPKCAAPDSISAQSSDGLFPAE